MISNNPSGLSGLTVKPLTPEMSAIISGDLTSSYLHKKIEYFNGTRYDVTIVDRTGVVVRIPRYPNAHSGRITMRVTWVIRRDMVDEFLTVMDGYQFLNNPELNAIVQTVISERKHWNSGHISAHVDYEIMQSEFTNLTHSFYLTNQDTVFSILRPSETPSHPHSLHTADVPKEVETEFKEEEYTHLKIEYIDNTKTRGDRFVNLCGKVHKLKPKCSVSRSDGIYLYSREKKLGTKNEYYIEKKHVLLDDAEKELGVYKTSEEALYGGDPKNGIKIRLIEAERELTDIKHELLQKNLKLESQLTDNKIREAEYKALREDLQRTHDLLRASEENRKVVMNNELMNRKHEMEMTTLNRKETYDLIKMVPGLVLVVGAAFIALTKAKSA